MPENSSVVPSGKLLFGVDYLNVMRFMEFPDDDKAEGPFSSVVDAVIRLFLLRWDFSVEEIDESNRLFWEKVKANKLEETIDPVINRIVDFIKDDKKAQERLVVEMVTVAHFDKEITKRENWIAERIQKLFDMRPSEFDRLDDIGISWFIALNFLGEAYIEYSKLNPKQ